MTAIALLGFGCSSDKGNSGESATTNAAKKASAEEAAGEHGVGPVEHVELTAEIDAAMVEKGKVIFEGKCTVCHQFEERYVGPALAGVTERIRQKCSRKTLLPKNSWRNIYLKWQIKMLPRTKQGQF